MKRTESIRGGFSIVFGLILMLLITSGASAMKESAAKSGGKPYPYDPEGISQTGNQMPGLDIPGIQGPSSDVDYRNYEQIVYQSYRGGDWEIYRQQGYGPATNITVSPGSADITPRLSNGLNRVVFSSNRTGTIQIYICNLDGSGLTQVTYNASNSTNPAWFPDDSKLAYVFNNDIYRINVDGSSNTRLTTSGTLDHDPAVSPDGTRIAYVATSGNYGKIWIMNSNNGLENHTITPTNLKYLQNTAWSPDNLHIGFDYDSDGDEWNDLAEIHSDGSNKEILYMSADLMDVWMGGYSTNPDRIIFSRVIYGVNTNGTLYFDKTYSLSLNRIPYQTVIRLSPSDYDLFPDWKSLDRLAPSSQVNPLPEYTRPGTFTLTWSGTDAGIAGIHGYFLQGKRHTGDPWTDLLSWEPDIEEHTHNSSYTVGGSAGEYLYYQVSAIDNAGNREIWPGGSGDASTKVFSYYLEGTVTDNQGNPLPDTQLTLTPAAWNESQTDSDGSYFYRLATTGSHSLSSHHDWFGQWASLTRNITSDIILPEIYLPPIDNLLTNGDIETTLAPWATDGNLPPGLSNANSLTGSTSAYLSNKADIPAGVKVDNGVNYPFILGLKKAPDGSLHAIWTNYNSSVFFYYAHKPVSGSWSTPVQLASSTCTRLNQMDLAVDSNGIAHVTWQECQYTSINIMYVSRNIDGSWSTPISVSGAFTSTLTSQPAPRIDVDDDLGLYLVWNEPSKRMFSYKPDGGSWSTKEQIPGLGSASVDTPIVVDSTGTLHLVSPSASGMVYINRAPDGIWSSLQYFDGASYYFQEADMTVDASDHLHLAWVSISPVYYMERDGSGVWSAPMSMSSPSIYFKEPSISSAGDGNILLGWQDGTPVKTHFRIRYIDGSWSPEQVLIDNSNVSGLEVCAGEGEGLHFLVSKPGPSIYYYYIYQPRLVESSLSQVIAIPAGMIKPTLAFNLHTEINPGAGVLQVLINDTSIATYSVSDPSFSFHMFDLSAYAGNSVEVMFKLQADYQVGVVKAWLDDVSLGSYQMPRIDQISPSEFITGWQGQILTATGSNFIDPVVVMLDDLVVSGVTYINDTSLLIELPADFPPGIYDLRIINPQGHEAVLVNALRLGLPFYLPLINRANQ